jgi:hypothetical protein
MSDIADIKADVDAHLWYDMRTLLMTRFSSSKSQMYSGSPSLGCLNALQTLTDNIGAEPGGGGFQWKIMALLSHMYIPIAAIGLSVQTAHQQSVQYINNYKI